MLVLVPSERPASCVVPAVVGLRFEDAKARIALAKCSVGAVIRRDSERPLGTVLDQRPREKLRRAKGTTISLVVSNGQLPA